MTKKPSDILTSFADEIVQRILAELGDDNVASIFLSGSAVKGEIAFYIADGFVELYSDVDLWVILADGVDLSSSRERVGAAVAEIAREGDGYRIFPSPDVGVFSRDDFRSQQARPGTADIRRSHRVLFGRPDIASDDAWWSASDINNEEALYLLEHRLIEGAAALELVDEVAAMAVKRYVCYILSKNCLDAVTAALIVVGAYAPTRDERLGALTDDRLRSRVEPLLSGSIGVVEACQVTLDDLQSALPANVARLPELGEAVRGVLLETWKRIAHRIVENPSATWTELIAWRCSGYRPFDNLRELLVLARRLGASRTGLLVRSAGLARFSPTCALRLSGLVEALVEAADDTAAASAVGGGYLNMLDELTKRFGFHQGSVLQRGRQMYRAVS